MTNKFLLNLLGFNPDLTTRQSRVDSVSFASRLRVLGITMLCLLTLGVGSAWGTNVTYSFDGDATPTTTGTAPAGSTAALSGTYSNNSGWMQCANSGSAVLTLSGYKGYKITAITITVKSNKSSGTGSFSVVAGSTTIASIAESAFNSANWNGAWNNTSSGVTKTLTMTNANYEIKNGENVTFSLNVTSSGKSIYIKEWAITYEAAGGGSTPSLTPTPTSLDWGSVLQSSSQSTKTFDISGSNLTGNLSVAVTGGYSVSCGSSITVTSGTPNVTTITVTPPSTSTTGTKNGTVTISGGGLASNVVVNLSMTVNAASTVTWMNNGSEYTTTLVANGSKPTFPSNPSSCDGTSTTFVGWSTSAWSGKLDDVSAKTIYTSASAMPNVSGPVTYHAVFAKVNANTYKKGTKDDLTDGQTVLIVNPDASYAMSSNNGSSSGRLAAVSVTISANKITKNDATLLWTVETSSSDFKFKQGTKYLWANSSNNQLYASSSYEDAWSVTAQSGHYIIHNVSVNKDLQYYSTNFSTYNTGTGVAYQMDFYIPDCSQYLTNCCTALGSINGSFF